ncbi:MAG: valine--tRNA ligase, partial [Desulfobacterales bacterium]
TGVLHIGHALDCTLQDILSRYRRSRGDNVLWMPGTDHAGIATQNVVERELAEQGTDRHEMGREKFVEAVWQWREKYGGAIINQLKRLGSSCDWQRERFTMDEGLSRAVRKVFVQLYEEGLIYRGNYIVNWCPRCHTAISDLEVEHEEVDGHLWHIRYPFPDGTGGIVVATTRPETMVGDTAVAVHPEDERYAHLPSETVMLPLMNREIPIIRDSYVDMTFGSGGLKVTPAHDPNDFDLAVSHNLPSIKVIGDDGKMTAEAGKYEGLDRDECREAVVADLEAAGLLEKVEPYRHSVGHCYRCNTAIEPNLSLQWFVSVKPLAEKAIAAVENGETRIIPKMWEKSYFDWMHNIRDWCISRQIWWGHQIPAWTCEDCQEMIVAIETPEKCPACQGKRLIRETDVLDTWFSSALWPFSTMGWPDSTPLLKTFYPTSVLVTGFDILRIWVAKMMMMGIHFMGEVPFREVYIHALVQDEEGKKMSKSKGNVSDPLEIMDTYGTDAFRFTLAAFAAQGRDIKMSEKRVEGYRHFVNKLWNASRFALMHLPEGLETAAGEGGDTPIVETDLSLPDRWILARRDQTMDSVSQALDEYRFNEAASALYQFVWHEFCDWYLEAIKPRLYDEAGGKKQAATKQVLGRVLRDILVMLHPITPFITEELWHRLPGTTGSIMKAAFPADDPSLIRRTDASAESEMDLVMGIITGIRNIRGEMNIAPSELLTVAIQSKDKITRDIIKRHLMLIHHMAKLSALTIESSGARPKAAATSIFDQATIFVLLEGVVDFSRESLRLEKEMGKIATELFGVTKKLNNSDFLKKAPEAVVEKVKEKSAALLEKQEKLQSNLDRIRAMEG